MFHILHLFTVALIIYCIAVSLLLWKIPNCGKKTSGDRPALGLKKKSGNETAKRLVSIIIPARNEEKRLPRLLKSLHGEKQRLPEQLHLEIIVVNDRSEDDTKQVAEDAGARVLTLENAPEGRAGKSRACKRGAEAAKGDLFLFLDADTWFVPGGLLRVLELQQPGLVSIQPYHVTERFYESFSAYFNIIVMSGVNAFTPFSTEGKPKGCFGPCLLCSKEDYFTAGGHGAIETELVDDIALARLFVDRGLPVHCFGGRKCVEFRMYPAGMGDLTEGWTKNMATGAKFSSLATNILLFFWIAGVTNLFLSFLQAGASGRPLFLIGSAVVYILYSLQLYLHLRRIGNFFPLLCLLFPVYLLFFILLFMYSIVKTKFVKKVRWRGRDISL